MATYEPRSAWTPTTAGGDRLTGAKLVGVSVHYPAAGNVDRNGAIRRLQGYREFHVNGRGWADIGYQVCVDQAGRVWDLRGIARVPAASASDSNPDANHEWGACLFLVGNAEEPTEAAVEAFQHWRTTRWLARWPNATQIRGHGQVPGASTACPGAHLRDLIADGVLAGRPRPEIPTPTDWEDDDVFVSKYGSSAYRLIAGGRIAGLSKAEYDELVEYGVPVRTLSNEAIEILEAKLPPVSYEVWSYKNAKFGEADAYARLRKAEAAAG